MLYKVIFFVSLICCSCGNYVGWSTDPEFDLEEYTYNSDRTVYNELSDEDIIDVMNEVMTELDPSWPGDLPNDCLERLSWFEIIYIPSVEKVCDGLSALACIQPSKWKIFISTEGRNLLDIYESLNHEFVHYIGKCMYKDIDSDHINEFYWEPLDKYNSIEAQGNKLIFKRTR